MIELRTWIIVIAVAGAAIALTAAVGKLSGRLGDRLVDRLYYASYVFTGFSALLFVLAGLFAGRR